MTDRRKRGMCIAVVAVLVLAGCSTADGTSDTTDGGAGTDDAVAITTTTFDAATWPDRIRPPSYGPVDPLVSLERIDEIVGNKTENLLKRRDDVAFRCLEDAGFDFKPTESRTYVPDDVRTITNAEFAEQFAFGVTGAMAPSGDLKIMQVNSLEPSYGASIGDVGIPLVPTVAPVGSDPAGFEEVNNALNVDTDDRVSCATKANDELELDSSGPFYAANELRRLVRDTFDNHPEIQALRATYEACMTAAGFEDLASPTETFAGARAGLDELMGMMAAITSTPEEARDPDNADGATRDRFGELHEREVALAQANLGCEGAYTPAALQLVDVVQRQVLAAHQPLVAIIQAGG